MGQEASVTPGMCMVEHLLLPFIEWGVLESVDMFKVPPFPSAKEKCLFQSSNSQEHHISPDVCTVLSIDSFSGMPSILHSGKHP